MRNIHLISASAGSGKTYSLTEQVFQAVASGVSPERIMAVTFTNKAAAELKERIHQRLVQNQGQQNGEMIEKAGFLADAYIGTVNSICARLLREFAFDAGDSPAVEILPEQETERLFRLSVSHVIGSHYDKLAGPARRLARDGTGSGYAKKPDWRDDVQRIVDLARANGLDQDSVKAMAADSIDGLKKHLGKTRTSLSSAALLKRVRQAIKDIQALDDSTKATKGALSSLRRSAHALEHDYATWADWRSLASVSAAKRSGADDYLEALREYAAQLQHHPKLHDDIEALIEGVFSCAAGALEAFASYKRINGLMDFADQESKVVQLLDSTAVRQRLAENIDLVLVDEFQDTSPIQLALFSKLAALVDQNIWVGDQKQAIYGFRGTDPELMDDVIEQLDDDQIGVLGDSYRSRPALVQFANELFVRALDGVIPAERVRLHAMRKDHSAQNEGVQSEGIQSEGIQNEAIAVWLLAGSRKEQRACALSHGIAELLRQPEKYSVVDRESEELRPIQPGDIAVLSRSNDACRAIAEGLAGYGIRASVGRGALFAQRESILALASLHLLADHDDMLALTELVQCLPEHASATSWLSELAADPEDAPQQWQQNERIRQLLDVNVTDQSPLELFECVSDILGLEEYAFRCSDPAQVLANIEALARLAGEYQDACKARHEAATLPGMIYWLGQQDDPGMPEGRGEQTVQVVTYHRSKGLEWPLVILNNLDSQSRFSAFGVAVTPADHFDPTRPLAGRGIRFWPEPFNGKDLPFGEAIESSDEYAKAAMREEQERQRVMYVGMTRARDYLIHAIPYYTRKKTGDPEIHCDWLHSLIPGGDGVVLPEPGDDPCAIRIGKQQFACLMEVIGEDESPEPVDMETTAWFMPETADPQDYEPYRLSPSNNPLSEAQTGRVQTVMLDSIGETIKVHRGIEMNLLGEAVHRFLAADDLCRQMDVRKCMADRLLNRWSPDSGLGADQLIAISDSFHQWVAGNWPNGRLLKEWPVRLKEGNRVAHGWIDALIETDEGYVLVDHKTIGADIDVCMDRVKEYAGQLALYQRAIQAATGKPVLDSLIHLPLQGSMVRVVYDG
ncbi:MAG: UvrD-helicase domain-containing protein [Mariprofundus sp.]